jgi:hypothetical protein
MVRESRMSFVSNIPGQVSTVTVPPGSIEISVPFSIDPSGDIAVVSDPVRRACQYLQALALTSPGERVMRPTYGVGLRRMVFENSTLADFKEAALQLQSAFLRADLGNISNVSVSVATAPGNVFLFQATFTLEQDTQLHRAVFNYKGQLVGSS